MIFNWGILMQMKYWGIALALLLPIQAKAIGYSSDYISCMNSAGNSTSSITRCIKSEFNDQDDRMKSLFKKTLDLYTSKEKKLQKKYQKTWLKMRSEQCGKSQKSASDTYAMKYYNCALKQTVTRANMLEKLTYRL